MQRPGLDLNLLVTLRVLLAERSVTRAAQIMCVTQPAMSASLARLRDYFDDHLIVQMGRRMELTPLGESLVAPLTDTMTHIQATLATRPSFDPGSSNRCFSILASDYVFSVLLQGVLRRMELQAPGVRLELRPPEEGAAALLDGGAIDLLVVPPRFASAGHESTPLFDDDYRIVADADNRWVDGPLSFERYLELGHVVFDHFGKPDYDLWFEQRHGDLRSIELTVNSFWQMAQSVVGTRRVAVMPARMAQAAARALSLRQIVPAFETPKFSVVMQWHKYRNQDPGSAWLRGLICEQAAVLREGGA